LPDIGFIKWVPCQPLFSTGVNKFTDFRSLPIVIFVPVDFQPIRKAIRLPEKKNQNLFIFFPTIRNPQHQ
jgi:hypothetical protein